MKFSIVIPAYNEENRIGKTLKSYYNYFKDIKKKDSLDFEILVVINNSNDGTLRIVKNFKKDKKEINFLNIKEPGKGNAIVQGFKYFLKRKTDFIGFVDADLSTKPLFIHKLLNNISDVDGVIASRRVEGSKIYPKPSLLRRVASLIFNLLFRILFLINIRDTQCGAKVFTKEAIRSIIHCNLDKSWNFDISLIYYLINKKYSIKEVPIDWSDSSGSKLNIISDSISMFISLIRLRIRTFTQFVNLQL